MLKSSLIINSQFINTNRTSDVVSPDNNEKMGEICLADLSHVEDCFISAKLSFKNWSDLSQFRRNEFLVKIKDELLLQKESLGKIISEEVGKPLVSAIDEVTRSAEYIQLTIEAINNIFPESYESITKGYLKGQKIAFSQLLPVGCVVCISPFNYPINLAVTKIIPALASGNAVIFKPSSQGALSGFALAKIFNSILPNGVFQFITGKSDEIGDALVQHEDCSFVNFTGSSKTGKHIASVLNDTSKIGVKGLVLEMGGKDSAIITPTADIFVASYSVLTGAFSYNGQRCTAVKRVFIAREVAEIFIKKIKEGIEKLSVGKAAENNTITPLIDERSAKYIEDLFVDAINSGCKNLFEFQREKNLVHPNVVVYDGNISFLKNIRIFNEEQFGPIMPIYIYDDLYEVVDFINSTEYGLQNSIFSESINECIKVARWLESGTVQINGKSDRGPDNFPFSGIKNSGFGVQGVKDSILSMTRKKTIVLNID